MKRSILLVFLSTSLGILAGWLLRGAGEEAIGIDGSDTNQGGNRTVSLQNRRSNDSALSKRPLRWMPEEEDHFLDPQSEEDRGEVRRLVRTAIEKEPNFHTRMKAVCDLLSLMTPENAHDIRDAFVNSRNDGYWYGLERKVFLARYGEIMGAEAMDEFKNDPDFVRALESWALVAPSDAVDWVNELGPGRQQDEAINRLIGAYGSTDLDYAIEVFTSLTDEDRRKHQRALTEAAIRSGGKENGTYLALKLLQSEAAALQQAGKETLKTVFEFYQDPEERLNWLRGLPNEVRAELNQSDLPEEYRVDQENPDNR